MEHTGKSRSIASALILGWGVLAAIPAGAQGVAGSASSGLPAAVAASAPQPAQILIDGAVKTAKAENKTVLVYFTASWCGWCKRFGKFLDSPEVGKLISDNYVVVKIDVQEDTSKKALENAGGAAIMNAMGGEKAGIPFFFFLDGDGKKLANSMLIPSKKHPGVLNNIGHPATPEEVLAFDGLLKQTAPKMTDAQRTEISTYLTSMANMK